MAAGVAFARDLVNLPGADLWPDRLATLAAAMAAEEGLACQVFGDEALASLGAGALLGVGRGSERPPRLVHLRYRPAGAADAPRRSPSSARASPSTPAATRSSRPAAWRR